MSVKAKKKATKPAARRKNGARKAAPGQKKGSAWDLIEELIRRVDALPPEVFANTPRDLAKNVDHYLYGHPKVD